MHFFSWTWQEDNRAENTPETKGKGKEAERHLAAGEGQPPLPVRTTPQRGAAGQQVEARYGLLLCDLPVPEVVGGQPALGHGGPASERNHGEQVVQDPAGARLWEEGNTSSPSPGNIDPPPTPQVYLQDYGGQGSVSLQPIRSGNPPLGAASQFLHGLAHHPPEPACHQGGGKVTPVQSLRRPQGWDGAFP